MSARFLSVSSSCVSYLSSLRGIFGSLLRGDLRKVRSAVLAGDLRGHDGTVGDCPSAATNWSAALIAVHEADDAAAKAIAADAAKRGMKLAFGFAMVIVTLAYGLSFAAAHALDHDAAVQYVRIMVCMSLASFFAGRWTRA